MIKHKRGGRRPGAGRPQFLNEPTKAIRLPESIADKAKSGYYEAIETLLIDWQFQSEDESPTSPRWQKARELLEQFKQIREEYTE